MTAIEIFMSVSGVAITVCALGFSWRTYMRSAKAEDPDPARVQRFIETAPMDRLGNIQPEKG